MDLDPSSSPTPAVDDVTKAVGNSIMMLLGCGFVTLLLIAAAIVAIILIVRRNKSRTVMLQVLNVRDALQADCPVGRVIVEAQPHWITVPPSQVSAFRWHQQNGVPAPCVVYPNRNNAGMMQGQLATLPPQPPLQQH